MKKVISKTKKDRINYLARKQGWQTRRIAERFEIDESTVFHILKLYAPTPEEIYQKRQELRSRLHD